MLRCRGSSRRAITNHIAPTICLASGLATAPECLAERFCQEIRLAAAAVTVALVLASLVPAAGTAPTITSAVTPVAATTT